MTGILVIDDERLVRSLMVELLQRAGYDVFECESALGALDLLEDERVSLVVSDVLMPGLSGRQVAEQLTGVRPKIRVLFMSGYTDNVIAQRGVLEAGTAFLSKPFTPDALADKVRGVLD